MDIPAQRATDRLAVQTSQGVFHSGAAGLVGWGQWSSPLGTHVVVRHSGLGTPEAIGNLDEAGNWVWVEAVEVQEPGELLFKRRSVNGEAYGLYLQTGLRTEVESATRHGNWEVRRISDAPVYRTQEHGEVPKDLLRLESYESLLQLGLAPAHNLDITPLLDPDWWGQASRFYTRGYDVPWSVVVRSLFGWMAADSEIHLFLPQEALWRLRGDVRSVAQGLVPLAIWADSLNLPLGWADAPTSPELDAWGMGDAESITAALGSVLADISLLGDFVPFRAQRMGGVYLQYFWSPEETPLRPVWVDTLGRRLEQTAEIVRIHWGQAVLEKSLNTLPTLEWVGGLAD